MNGAVAVGGRPRSARIRSVQRKHYLATPLQEAVEAGDLSRVEDLVAAGADIEGRDRYPYMQYTPLIHAAQKGLVAVVRYLLDQGADINARSNSSGQSALHTAAESGHLDAVKVLIEYGANKHATCEEGETPLHQASAHGHPAVAEYLLEQGCDVNFVSRTWKWTPLHIAAVNGQLDTAQVLMRWGARLDLRDVRGMLAAELAIEERFPEVGAAIRAEELRRRDHGFKRDRSTIEGTEEREAAKRPREEREAEEALAAAAAAAPDESDDDDDDDDDEEEGS